ncbi:MFS transporter [Falsibacillus albus]|uniref:MFS transporter n=1 Tax=Falsibacillus albus TaxID=2478915 RepID=A0A3L7JZP8_9BACI|nr:MFS transporter [Falsibacillus albus]RLQ96257.1 MFS transporter [Falsibacillus albus]
MNSIWRNKNFLLLWAGNSVSVLGSRFYMIAVMWYIIQETGSSMALGISVLCFTIPSVLLMPIGGVLADRNMKKQLMAGTDFINGILMMIISCLIYSHSLLFFVYTTIVISSSVSAFFSPANSAAIPLIVGKEQLSKANSLTQVTSQLSNILGPALAGILISATDIWILFVMNGISFLISACSELFISIPNVDEQHSRNKLLSQLQEGLKFVLNYRSLLHLIVVGGIIINFFLAPLQVYITMICSKVIHTGPRGMGFVDASISIGALIGSMIIYMQFFKDKIKMVIFGLSIEGLSLLIGGIFVHHYVAIIACALILGLGISLASVGISTLFQTLVPDEKRGRVGSVLSTLSTFIVPFGTLFGSFIIVHVSIGSMMILSGVMVALSGISLLVPFVFKKRVQPSQFKNTF